MNSLLRLGGTLVVAAAAVCAHAETFPNKLIKIVVPFPPGSDLDPTARGLGDHFRAAWGQPYIVENKPGANAARSAGASASTPGPA